MIAFRRISDVDVGASPRACAAWPWWLWPSLGLIGCLEAIWLAVTPLSLSASSLLTMAQLLPVVLLGTWAGPRLERWPRLHTICVGGSFLLVAWPVLRLYNHLSMTTNFPLVDVSLAASDAAIGFDWLAYVAWLDKRPGLLTVMDYAYTGLTGYSILLFLILATDRDPAERCSELVKLFIITALSCSTIGMFFPALSANVHHSPPAGLFQHIGPETGTYHLQLLNELRSNPAHVLDLWNLPGLVTFPSFHTAMGVVAMYCTRRDAVVMGLSLAVNLTMIASTPVFGAHYAIDILAGAAVAGAAILTLRRGSRLAGQGRPVNAWAETWRPAAPHCG